MALMLVCVGACKPEGGTTDSDPGGEGSGESSEGPSTDPTTGGDESSESGGSGESGTDPSGSGSGTDSDGPGDPCAALTDDECEADPACMQVIGSALEFEGCSGGKQVVACMTAAGCPEVETTVCRGSEVYVLPNGCVPQGFDVCDEAGPLCGTSGQCELLGEDDCAAGGCTPILGAPHVESGGEACADFGAQVFLGCLAGGISCPPGIVTVCPDGQPGMAFDVAAGCIPPDHNDCGVGPLPECP